MGLRNIVRALSVVAMAMVAGNVCSQDYPTRPIRILTGGAGGGNDFIARTISQGMSSALGQPVVIENRASQVIAGEGVAKALPDGYTLGYFGIGLWITSILQKTSYDPLRDFAPISLVTNSPIVLVAHPTLPVKSVKDLIALAKAKPGQLNYSSSGIGGSTHLAMELLKSMAGINIVHIPYKGGGTAINDLLTGQVQLAFYSGTVVRPFIDAGKLHALAVSTAKPSALFPGVPTVAASGVPGYVSSQMNGLFAPANTPASVIARLNQDVVRFANRPEVKEKFLGVGVETVGSTPEELGAAFTSEMTKMAKLIKDVGIRAE